MKGGYIEMKRKSIEELFEIYKKQHKTSTRYINKKLGQDAVYEAYDSIADFETDLNMAVNSVENGKVNRVKIAQEMARDDAYGVSKAVLNTRSKALELQGIEDVKIDRLGYYGFNSYDGQKHKRVIENNLELAINNRYEQLKKEGLNSSAIAIKIGQEFFGSP